MLEFEITIPKIDIKYRLYGSHNGTDYFAIGGNKSEYNTPNKLLASLKQIPYFDINKWKKIKLIKVTHNITSEEIEINNFKI